MAPTMNLQYVTSLQESYIKSPFIIEKSENKAVEKFLNLSLSQNKLIAKNANPIIIGRTLIILLATTGRDLLRVLEMKEYEQVVSRYLISQNHVSMQPNPRTDFASSKLIKSLKMKKRLPKNESKLAMRVTIDQKENSFVLSQQDKCSHFTS